MTAFAWQFESLDVIPTYQSLTNVVESMHWHLTADDGLGHHATACGETKAGPVDVNNFTPFESLTEAIVQGWCETQMGDELTAVQSQLVGQINEQVNPSIVSMTPPWT